MNGTIFFPVMSKLRERARHDLSAIPNYDLLCVEAFAPGGIVEQLSEAASKTVEAATTEGRGWDDVAETMDALSAALEALRCYGTR